MRNWFSTRRRRRVVAGAAAVAAVAGAAIGVSTIPRGHHVPEGDVRFKTVCPHSHTLRDDPIVFPNQQGASHSHDFSGNRLSDFDTFKFDDLQLGTTTCTDTEDKASYWSPSVFANGVKVDPLRTVAYYRLGRKHPPIQPYPNGLKIIAGFSSAEGHMPGDYGWKCNGAGGVITRLPQTCPTDEHVMTIAFPDCWDGSSRNSVNHRSHMAYSAAGPEANICPPAHPVQVPELTLYIHFPGLNGKAVTLGENFVSPSNPATGADTVHADFNQAWVRTRLVERIDTCLNGLLRCDA